jgi:hypothetical protein
MSKLQNKHKHREYYWALASLTHELTGEETAEIFSYLEIFGVTGFFARIDVTDLPAAAKTQLNDLHQYMRSFDEVLADVHA